MANNRKIDAEKLNDEQLDKTIEALSVKIREKVDATCEEINEMLARYGMICKMEIAINTKDFFDSSK